MDTIYTIDVIKTSFGIILNNFLEEFLWIFLCIFLWHLALTTIIGDCLQKNFKRKQSDQDGFRMFQDCESTKCEAIRGIMEIKKVILFMLCIYLFYGGKYGRNQTI